MGKAQTKASNKYNKEHYAKIQANVNKEVFQSACAHCHLSGDSKAQLITKAVDAYIQAELREGKYTEEQFTKALEDFKKENHSAEETE